MLNTWAAASIVAVIAGVTGFFAVLRGQSFAAHAIPNGTFAGAAGAGLLGLNVIWGLAVFALGGALGIGALGRRARQDVVTALVLVLMLGLGALFLSLSTEYAEVTYSLLFGGGVRRQPGRARADRGPRHRRRRADRARAGRCYCRRRCPRSPTRGASAPAGWSCGS